MVALERRSILQSRVFGWSLLALLPIGVFLFFAVSLGMAMIACFAVLLTTIVLAVAVLMRRKLAYDRHERELLITEQAH